MTAGAAPAATTIDHPEFRRGFLAMTPLWIGLVPFAFTYALLAGTSGLTGVEIMALAVFVFAGPAQLAFVDFAGDPREDSRSLRRCCSSISGTFCMGCR